MLIVDKVKGTPALAAARAARTSPFAHCMPVRPVGANASGIAISRPSIVLLSDRWEKSIATR